MANGYGSSSNTSTPNGNTLVAPAGYHYMENGELMSDAEHFELYGARVISSFDLDLSDIASVGENRAFSIVGDLGAEFRLDIKDNTTGYHYNFVTNVFQAANTFLDVKLDKTEYSSNINFPAITGSDDQYDVFFYAKPGTVHASYNEVRFGDGSLDINGSTGSNSLMIQKVLYQYAALALTLSSMSHNSSVAGTAGTSAISIDRGKPKVSTAFSLTYTAATTAAYRVLKQPTEADVLAFVSPVIGAEPSFIQSEDVFPINSARAAFTGDDVNGAVTSGAIIRIDGTVSGNVIVGDKLQTGKLSGTTAQESDGVKVILTAAVAGIMAVGDQIRGNAFLDAEFITVAALDPDGDNDQEFSMSQEVQIDGDVELTFVGEVNRKVVIVRNLDPTSGTNSANKFTISEDIQFRDNVPLSFFTRLNYRWPITNFAHILQKGMTVLPATNITSGSVLGDYTVSTTTGVGTEAEATIISDFIPAISTLGNTPTIVKGEITVQPGEIVFDRQQQLALAGDTIRIGGYGETEILRIHGYELKFSDLKLELNTVTTTTTSAVTGSTSVPVTSRNGILDDVSTVSGIGINAALIDPTVDTGAGAVTGAGTLVLTAAQTLENGATLTFSGAGQTATITGNVEVIKSGSASQSVNFDVEKLLSIT